MMKTIPRLVIVGFVSLSFSALAAVDLSKLPPASAQKDVTYAKDIKPLFETSCIRCHGDREHKGGIRLDSLEAALKGGKDGQIIEVGQSTKSVLVIAVAQLDPENAMPPKRKGGRRGPGGPGGPGREGRTEMSGTNAPTGEHRPGGTNAPGMVGRPPQLPAKPFTAEQVGLVRAWIDQGAK